MAADRRGFREPCRWQREVQFEPAPRVDQQRWARPSPYAALDQTPALCRGAAALRPRHRCLSRGLVAWATTQPPVSRAVKGL